MIPTTLGDSDSDYILPLSVKECLHDLQDFIVENSKTARAFLKKMQIPIPQSKLNIHVLNKHTHPEELNSFLNCVLNSASVSLDKSVKLIVCLINETREGLNTKSEIIKIKLMFLILKKFFL